MAVIYSDVMAPGPFLSCELAPGEHHGTDPREIDFMLPSGTGGAPVPCFFLIPLFLIFKDFYLYLCVYVCLCVCECWFVDESALQVEVATGVSLIPWSWSRTLL